MKKTISKKNSSPAKPVAPKSPAPAAKKAAPVDKSANEQRIKHVLKKLTGITKNTPSVFRLPSRRQTPVAFSLSEVRDLIKTKPDRADKSAKTVVPAPKKPVVEPEVKVKPRVLKSATLDDLLGGPKPKSATIYDEKRVPKALLPYYKKLITMRDELLVTVEERSEQTLRASAKESSGDLSSYSQHIADAGTDAYDYDFALSQVSSDKEMLREVEAAISRIFAGTYGLCEVTGKPISRERLKAVPFTRFSKEGQDQYERLRRRSSQRVGLSSSDESDDIEVAGGDDESGEV